MSLSPDSSHCVWEYTQLLTCHYTSVKWFETKKEHVFGHCPWFLTQSSPRDELRLPLVVLCLTLLHLLCSLLPEGPPTSPNIPRSTSLVNYWHMSLVSDLFVGSTSMILSVMRARFVHLHFTDGEAEAQRGKMSCPVSHSQWLMWRASNLALLDPTTQAVPSATDWPDTHVCHQPSVFAS